MHNRMNESSIGIRTENMLQKEKSIRFVAIIIIILHIYYEMIKTKLDAYVLIRSHYVKLLKLKPFFFKNHLDNIYFSFTHVRTIKLMCNFLQFRIQPKCITSNAIKNTRVQKLQYRCHLCSSIKIV